MAGAARRRRGGAGAGRAGSSAARSPSTGGCGAATTTPTTTAAAPSSDSIMADQLAGQWYADATGLGDLAAAPTGSTPRCGRSIAMNVLRLRRRPDGRGQRDAPGRHGRRLERAVGRGLGRDDLRAGRVHDRARADRRGLGDRRAARAAVTYERGLWFRTPEAYDAAGNFRASDLPAAAGDLGDRGGARRRAGARAPPA